MLAASHVIGENVDEVGLSSSLYIVSEVLILITVLWWVLDSTVDRWSQFKATAAEWLTA